MKLSEWHGEEAIDLIADLLEPLSAIFADEEWNKMRHKEGVTRVELVKFALKSHKKEVITILALLNKEDPNTYEPSLVELPIMIMDALNDEELMGLFQSQSQIKPEEFSGSATENIEADGQ